MFINECVGIEMVTDASALPHGLAVSATGEIIRCNQERAVFPELYLRSLQ